VTEQGCSQRKTVSSPEKKEEKGKAPIISQPVQTWTDQGERRPHRGGKGGGKIHIHLEKKKGKGERSRSRALEGHGCKRGREKSRYYSVARKGPDTPLSIMR